MMSKEWCSHGGDQMSVVNKVIKQLKLDVLSIQDVPESFSSSVYKIELVNHQIVYLKIPYSKGKWQVELTALNRFLPELPVPRVLDYWEGNEEITGALLLSAIEGNPLTARAMIEPRLAHQIGVQHAILHAIPILPADYNGAIVTMYEDWTAAMKRMFYSFAVDAEKALDRTLFRKAIDRFEQEHRFLPPPDGPCFVHMDFRAGNLLIKENTLKGIIDFESVKIGATEIDFHKLDRDLFFQFIQVL